MNKKLAILVAVIPMVFIMNGIYTSNHLYATTYSDTRNSFSFSIIMIELRQSNPNPCNGTTEKNLNPVLSITVNNTKGIAMYVTFRTNASGTWVNIGTNISVYNGTYQQSTSTITDYDTKYWWSVNLTDNAIWMNTTYNFKTKSQP